MLAELYGTPQQQIKSSTYFDGGMLLIGKPKRATVRDRGILRVIALETFRRCARPPRSKHHSNQDHHRTSSSHPQTVPAYPAMTPLTMFCVCSRET
eukprot:5471333-Prymnesium_polylepis.1